MTNGEKYEEEIVEILNSDKKSMCDDFVKKKVLAKSQKWTGAKSR